MRFTSTQIEDILRTGCHLHIPANNFTTNQLESMARIAKNSGGHFTFPDRNFTSTQLENIGRAGGSHVTIIM